LLPQAALDVPPFGCINMHASLLPRWRGADPITRAILAGDAESGVTIMQMVLEMDAGDMLSKRAIPIAPDDTGESLEQKLATLGAQALVDALAEWRAGRLTATPQDPASVTLAPMISKGDGVIDWQRSAAEIERAVRGYVPWPVAATSRAGAPLRVWRAALAGDAPPGAVPGTVLAVDARGIVVATGAGALALSELQAAGKKRMPARDWARGARVVAGEVLGT
jgi:methionyl-tRNA formyltransferase